MILYIPNDNVEEVEKALFRYLPSSSNPRAIERALEELERAKSEGTYVIFLRNKQNVEAARQHSKADRGHGGGGTERADKGNTPEQVHSKTGGASEEKKGSQGGRKKGPGRVVKGSRKKAAGRRRK